MTYCRVEPEFQGAVAGSAKGGNEYGASQYIDCSAVRAFTENLYRFGCTGFVKTGIVKVARLGLICRIVTKVLGLGSKLRTE
jgi:hypothetical protein